MIWVCLAGVVRGALARTGQRRTFPDIGVRGPRVGMAGRSADCVLWMVARVWWLCSATARCEEVGWDGMDSDGDWRRGDILGHMRHRGEQGMAGGVSGELRKRERASAKEKLGIRHEGRQA